jgi:nucleoside transporter
MNPVTARLALMMFLQFFIWGSWYVSMTGFINAEGMSAVTGAAYTIGPLAAILAPFFLGMISDRFFATERVLGVLQIVGGLCLIAAPQMARPFELAPAPESSSWFYKLFLHDLPAYQHPFILMLLLHMLCFMPTLALTASLSFRNLKNQEKEFPIVRVLGTIGWIVGNIAVSYLPGKDQSATQFLMAGGAGILLGFYSFTRPHTPPPLKGQKTTLRQILGTDSLKLFASPSYSIFMLGSFLICIPLAGYYSYARNYVEATDAVVNGSATFTMSFGQMSEVFFMLVMPLFFARLGVKWMLVAGMGAWVARYVLFAVGADDKIQWMILAGVLLHGICYDFFFVTGMIYVDKKAPLEVRNQAQGVLVLITQGLGLGLGAKLFFVHVSMHTSAAGVVDWKTVWLYPALFAAGVMVFFALFFHDKIAKSGSESKVATH